MGREDAGQRPSPAGRSGDMLTYNFFLINVSENTRELDCYL